MNTLKASILIFIVVVTISTNVEAEESTSNWFVGSGISFSSLEEDDGVSNSAFGIGIHGGYQFGNYLKLMVGANTASVSGGDSSQLSNSISSVFAVLRPQWEFDSGFLVYLDLGANSSNEGSGVKLGFGLGYNEGRHEVTAGLDLITLEGAQDSLGGVAIQYTYPF